MLAENQRGQGQRHTDSPAVANATMVFSSDGTPSRSTGDHSQEEGTSETAVSGDRAPIVGQNEINGMQSVWNNFRKRGFSEQTSNILMSSWKRGTKKQYNVFIKRWFSYCSERKIDSFSPTLEEVIEFLTQQFQNGLGYDSLNTARGALSSLGLNFEGFKVGSHPLVIRYMKGIFVLKPPKPRYVVTWDVNQVLSYLRKLSPVRHLSLKDLTLKLAMLMALTQAARVQTLHLVTVNGCKKLKTEFVFQLSDSLKQSRPSCKVATLCFKAYPPDRRLCIYTVLKEYLSRTRHVRNMDNNMLLISYVKPYKHVTRDTISRWLKTVMSRSGIDVQRYGSHSVRSAATSKAKINSVPMKDILQKAGWSNVRTFAKFYDKDIESSTDRFQDGVLQK